MAKCENCLHYNACLLNSEYEPSLCRAYKDKADVVEAVRCKDCAHYCGFDHCKNGICDRDVVSKRAVYPTDFCSYGERKEK